MIGTSELLVIFGVILLLFGGKKLPELARSIGLGIREFKKACNGIDEEDTIKKTAINIQKEEELFVEEIAEKGPAHDLKDLKD